MTKLFFSVIIASGMFVSSHACAQSSFWTTNLPMREVDAENTLVIDTTKGRVIVEIYPEVAPAHAERIKTLTRSGFYNGVVFHRVVEGFMAQTGDPKGTGEGGSDLPDIKGEFSVRRDANFSMSVIDRSKGIMDGFVGGLPVQSQVTELMSFTKDNRINSWGTFCPGVLGMARSAGPDSANSQFFLMRANGQMLDLKYTAFGIVVSGLEHVRKLKIGEPVINPDKMLKVQILADIPQAERPKVEITDTKSPQFIQAVNDQKKLRNGDFGLCDVSLKSNITQ